MGSGSVNNYIKKVRGMAIVFEGALHDLAYGQNGNDSANVTGLHHPEQPPGQTLIGFNQVDQVDYDVAVDQHLATRNSLD
jgi:hypothetical protein